MFCQSSSADFHGLLEKQRKEESTKEMQHVRHVLFAGVDC